MRQIFFVLIAFVIFSIALSQVSVTFEQSASLGKGKTATIQFYIGKDDIQLGDVYEFGHETHCGLIREAEIQDFIQEPSSCFRFGKRVATITPNAQIDGQCETFPGSQVAKVFSLKLVELSDYEEGQAFTFVCDIALADVVEKLSAKPSMYYKRSSSPAEEAPVKLPSSSYPQFVTPKVETLDVVREKLTNSYDLTIGVNAIGAYPVQFPEGYIVSFPEGFYCRSNLQPGSNTARFFAHVKDNVIDLQALADQYSFDDVQLSPYQLMKRYIDTLDTDDELVGEDLLAQTQYYLHFREADTVHCDVTLKHADTLYDDIVFKIDTAESNLVPYFYQPGITFDVNEDRDQIHVGLQAIVSLYLPKNINENDYFDLRITDSVNSISTLHGLFKPVAPLPKDLVYETFSRGFRFTYKGGPLLQPKVVIITFDIQDPPEQDNIHMSINLYQGTKLHASSRAESVQLDASSDVNLYPLNQVLYLRAVLAQSAPTWELIEEGKRLSTSVEVTALYTKQNKHWLTHFYLTDAYQDVKGQFNCTYYNKSQKETVKDARIPEIHVDHGSIHAFIEEDLAKGETMVVQCIFPLLYPNFVGYKPDPDRRQLRIGTWSWDKTTADGNALYYGFGNSPGITVIDVQDAPHQEVVALQLGLPYPVSLTNEKAYVTAVSKVFSVLNEFEDENGDLFFNGDLSIETAFGLINHPLLNATGIDFGPYTAVDVQSILGGAADTLVGVVKTEKVTVDSVKQHVDTLNEKLGDLGFIRNVLPYKAYDSSQGLDGCGSPMQRKCLFDGPCQLHTNCGGNGECYEGICTDLGVLYNPFSSASSVSTLIAMTIAAIAMFFL